MASTDTDALLGQSPGAVTRWPEVRSPPRSTDASIAFVFSPTSPALCAPSECNSRISPIHYTGCLLTLRHWSGLLDNIDIRPLRCATAPGFRFKLQSVAKPGQRIGPLDVNNPAFIAHARDQLQQFSVLDPSQADGVADSLIREVSLIQGCVVEFPWTSC